MPSPSLLTPNSILATSNSTYSDTSGAIFDKVEAVPNFQSASMRSMVPSNFSASSSSTNSFSGGDRSNALRVEDRISFSIKKKNNTDDRFIPRPPPPPTSSSSKAFPQSIRFSLPQNLTLKEDTNKKLADDTTTNSPSPRNLMAPSPSPRRPKPLNSATNAYNNQNNNVKTNNSNNSQDGMVEFSPVVPSPTKSTASLRKKNINDKSIIKKEKEDKNTSQNKLNQKTQNFLRRMSSSLREKMTVKEQLEYETNAKKELARCIPPKSKSLYQFDLPSSVVRSLVVLQNNTLCRFGGLGHEWMHLLFCKVPVVEGSLPSNWELYTRSCIEHGVEPLEEIRKNLSITPGRFDLKQLHLGCCGSFQDLGVKTILPLIYHNRHVIEDLQIQCAGITDEGLQTLLEALDDDEIPDSTRDNLAIALHPNCRMHRLVANGGHFNDDRLVGGGGGTVGSSSSGGNSPNRGGRNGSSSSPVSPLMPMRSSRNSTKKRDSSITIVDSEAGDNDDEDDGENNNNSLLLSSRIANNINNDASGNILGRDDSPASPNSKGLGDMIKMEKLRSAVRDVIYDGCKNLKRINLSCNTGIVKESSTALLCEFCEDHPSVIFVNVQQTKIDASKVRKVLLENRDKQMYARRMQEKENNVDGIAATSSLQELDDHNDDEDDRVPQIVGSAEFFSCSSQDTLTSRGYHNNNTINKLKATFNKVNYFQKATAKNVAAIRKNRHGGYLQPTACMNSNNRQQKANTTNSRPHSAVVTTISHQHQKQQSPLLSPSSTANNTQKNKSSSNNSEDLTTIDSETFKNDVKVFETFMNPYSGMLELSRMASSHPYLVSKISSHILAQRSKVEEKVYNDTVKNATIGGGAGGGTGGIFSRSKLPLAQIPELAKELRLSASRAAAEIDRNPSLSLETVNFIVYLQAMHPKVPVIEIERAIMKYCELAHADSVTKAQSALESVPMTVTVECLEMFDVLDEDKDGYVSLDDFLRISNSKEGKEAAVFMFERLGLGKVKREEFIPICIPFLTKM